MKNMINAEIGYVVLVGNAARGRLRIVMSPDDEVRLLLHSKLSF